MARDPNSLFRRVAYPLQGLMSVVLVYEGGPYAGQDDYLVPPPRRIGATHSSGYYQRTGRVDVKGRRVYEWTARATIGAPAGAWNGSSAAAIPSASQYQAE